MERELWVKWRILPLFERGKDLEVRPASRYFKKFQTGDILFINHHLRRKIKVIRVYDDFVHMLDNENIGRIYPGATADEILYILEQIYSPEQEAWGVLVFELEPI